MTRTAALACALALGFATRAFAEAKAEAPRKPAAQRAEQFCHELASITDGVPSGLFGRYREAKGAAASWRAYSDIETLQTDVDHQHVYEQAVFWQRADGAVHALISRHSKTGDWFDSTSYCFGVDGLLLRLRSVLSAFTMDGQERSIVRVRAQYFDPHTQLIETRRAVYDGESDRVVSDAKFFDQAYDTRFARTSELPFWHLHRLKVRMPDD